MGAGQRLFTDLAVGLALFAIASVRAQSATQSPITAADAVKLASAYTGLPEQNAASVAGREVTDSSVPLFPLNSVPVWEVTYDDVRIAVRQPDGEKPENPTIHAVRVLVHRETGALQRVESPMPSEGALRLTIGQENAALLSANGISVKPPAGGPAKSLIPILSVLDARQPGCVVQASHILASYGLFTYRIAGETLVADRPAWFVHLGGVSQPFPGGDSMTGGGSGPGAASEMLVILDAETGEPIWTYLAGGPSYP